MKALLLIAALWCSTFELLAQTVTRQPAESLDAFANRLKPAQHKLAHPVLEVSAWGRNAKSIIALYGFDDPADHNGGFNKIAGHLYLPTAPNQYRKISFGPLEENGGYPEILAVFFANADDDADKELLVLCKIPQQHYDYAGAFYETYIFDNPGQTNELRYFRTLSNLFFGCECNRRDGTAQTAKYQTAAAVKAGLKKLGY